MLVSVNDGLKRGALTGVVTGASKLDGGAEGGAATVGTGRVHDDIELVCVATEDVVGALETLCDEKDENREDICSCSLVCKVSSKEWFETFICAVSLAKCLIVSFKAS